LLIFQKRLVYDSYTLKQLQVNKMRGGKTILLITVGLIVVAVAACLLFFYKTQTTWVESPPYRRVSISTARTLVVVYSRTGNTLGAAKAGARFFDADLLQIAAPQYARTIKGQLLASQHADQEVTTTPIQHDPVDLSTYDLIFLCSPIWWFRPAPPLWSFVENHDFAGKPVFLLMTGNSRLKEELIDKFGILIGEKNGKFLGSTFIRRGRIYWQKTPDEVNEKVRDELAARQRIWPMTAKTD
jgi:flavodoxin